MMSSTDPAAVKIPMCHGSAPTAAREGAKLGTARRWLWLLAPLALLAVEIGVLTPLVEFKNGPMAGLAGPATGSIAIFAAVLFLAVAGDALVREMAAGRFAARCCWLGINLACYSALVWLSLRFNGTTTVGVQAKLAIALWVALGVLVGMSAVLTWFSLGTVKRWLEASAPQAVGALALGALLALMTPVIQTTWHAADPPAMSIARQLLEWRHPGRSTLSRAHDGDPILGVVPSPSLKITRYCAEMESLVAFLLLGVVLLVARARTVIPWRWLSVMLVGWCALYLINAARLALLVEIGVHTSVRTSVQVAHSRLSGMVLLGLGAAILLLSRSWWSPGKKPGTTSASAPVAA